MEERADLVTPRSFVGLMAAAALGAPRSVASADDATVVGHKDPNCGCCSGWVQHLRDTGFVVLVQEAADLKTVRARLGLPRPWLRVTPRRSPVMCSRGTCQQRHFGDCCSRPKAKASRCRACRPDRPAWQADSRNALQSCCSVRTGPSLSCASSVIRRLADLFRVSRRCHAKPMSGSEPPGSWCSVQRSSRWRRSNWCGWRGREARAGYPSS